MLVNLRNLGPGLLVAVQEPAATFSTCFGTPFMALHPTGDAQAYDATARGLRGVL